MAPGIRSASTSCSIARRSAVIRSEKTSQPCCAERRPISRTSSSESDFLDAASGQWEAAAERHFVVPVQYADFADFERRMLDVTYAERHLQRPAALRADEIDNALIAAAAQPSA